MTTESNTSRPPGRQITAELISIWIGTIAILVTMLALMFQVRSDQSDDIREIRQLIQASESGRQADARAINARVDAAEQLILASSPLPYRCPPLG